VLGYHLLTLRVSPPVPHSLGRRSPTQAGAYAGGNPARFSQRSLIELPNFFPSFNTLLDKPRTFNHTGRQGGETNNERNKETNDLLPHLSTDL